MVCRRLVYSAPSHDALLNLFAEAINWNAEAESGTLDEAGIQIRAVIHSESQTEALLNEIVEMIESDEQHREREIAAGRSDIIPSQERHDRFELLTPQIRSLTPAIDIA